MTDTIEQLANERRAEFATRNEGVEHEHPDQQPPHLPIRAHPGPETQRNRGEIPVIT